MENSFDKQLKNEFCDSIPHINFVESDCEVLMYKEQEIFEIIA